MGQEHLIENLRQAYDFSRFEKLEQFAHLLSIHSTAAGRYLSGKRIIPVKHLSTLASHVNVRKEDFYLEPKEFKDILNRPMSSLPPLSFTSVVLHKAKWQAAFERLKGQYKVYYGVTADDCVIVSLLSFDRLSPDGMTVSFYNPYRDAQGNMSCYEYTGLAFPVNELVYIYAEQKNKNDYEILTMILSLSRTPTVEIFEGVIVGVGVKQGESMVAANSLICNREKRNIDNPLREVGKGLGYIPRGKTPRFVQNYKDQRIRLRS